MHTVQGEKLWESKQQRRIPICFQPLAALAGDYEDECVGPGSVVRPESLWEVTRIKGSPGSA